MSKEQFKIEIDPEKKDHLAESGERGELLIDTSQLAQMFGISVGTAQNWRSKGRGPAYIKVGGNIRYHMEDLERWLTQQRVEIK